MDEKQMEELNKAISKLSEKDQEQIAAAGVINDEQCKKIKLIDPKIKMWPVTSYGGAIVGFPKCDPIKFEELLEEREEEKKLTEVSPSATQKTDEQ